MHTTLESSQQTPKYAGDNLIIDNWLATRKALLVKYCELAGLPPFKRVSDALPAQSDITSFCELLVDYVSAGHFEVYEKLMSESESQIGQNISEQIASSTESALRFNDDYADVSADTDFEQFDIRLSTLGQQLEARFAFEDELIQRLS